VANVVTNIDEWWTSEVPAQRFLLNRKDVQTAEADPPSPVPTKQYHYLAEHLSVLRRVSSKGFRHRNKMYVEERVCYIVQVCVVRNESFHHVYR
jgi:hypothetical protein